VLRHRIHLSTHVDDVIEALNQLDFVEVYDNDSLKTIRLTEAIGTFRSSGEGCVIDLFDDDGVEVERLVAELDSRGFDSELETTRPNAE
jgi:hypothetical protein